MFDDSVAVLFYELEDRLGRLAEKASVTREEYAQDRGLQSQVERDFQVAIQCCLDLGNHLLARRGHGPPASYREIFLSLGRLGYLPSHLAADLADLASFRNVLVHGYLKLDPNLVHGYLGKLHQLRQFAAAVAAPLRREGEGLRRPPG